MVDSPFQTRQRKRKRAPIAENWYTNRKFGVVIDAGSSGSRIQVYSWLDHNVAIRKLKKEGKPLNKLPRVDIGVPDHGDNWHSKVKPGISSFAAHPAGVDAHLQPLLDHAVSLIPPDRLSDTPIYLLATAGMRLLPSDQQDAILQRACWYISQNYAFNVGNCKDTVRIITGEEEGLFGWISVNYLMDGFDAHGTDSATHAHDSKTSSTFGFLDMGGASTQIAFEPSETERIKHADNLVTVTLRNLDGRTLNHPIFVTTWLGYGTNKARERYVESVISKQQQDADTGSDAADLGTERIPQLVQDPCLPKSLLLTEGKEGLQGYMLQGTGSFEECVRSTAPLLNKDAPCPDDPCLFNGVHAPAIDFSVNQFIGISEYWYSTHDVFSMGGMYDFVTFEKSAAEYCSREWSDIVETHKSGTYWKPSVELSRLEMQCFKAAWIVNILHEGFGIPRIMDKGGQGNVDFDAVSSALAKADEKGFADTGSDGVPTFQSKETIGDIAISWTLGKMVLEVSQMIPSNEPDNSNSKWTDQWSDQLSDHFSDWKEEFHQGMGKIKEHRTPLFSVFMVILLSVCGIFLVSRCRRKSWSTSSRRRSDLFSDSADTSTLTKRGHERTSSSPIGLVISRFSFWRRRILGQRRRSDPILPLVEPIVRSSPRTLIRHAASSPNLNMMSNKPFTNSSASPSTTSLTRVVSSDDRFCETSSLRPLKAQTDSLTRTNKPKWSQLELIPTSYDNMQPDMPTTPVADGMDNFAFDRKPFMSRTSSLYAGSRNNSMTNLANGLVIARRKEKDTERPRSTEGV